MRVAFFHNRYRERGGEDVALEAQMELLAKAGHEVCLLQADNRREAGGLAGALRAGRSALGNPRTPARLDAFLAEHPCDVAHVHNFFPMLSSTLHVALARRGIPVVQTLHNYRLLCANALLLREGRPCRECVDRGPWNAVRHGCWGGSRPKTALWAAMTRRDRRRGVWSDVVDAFTAPSELARRELVAGGLPADRLFVVPNPVPDPGAGGRGGPGAVCVGRLSPEKGVDLLLDAWRDLEGHPLTIVGDGPLRASLERRARGRAHVRFTGERTHAGALEAIAAAGFVVVPSRAIEVFGMTVVEAMACGRAVVVPAGSAMAEPVEHGRSGLLFAPGDAASLAEACGRLARDPALAASLGARARRAYEERFASEEVVAALESVYGFARRRASAARASEASEGGAPDGA